jgi:hypothetical protein
MLPSPLKCLERFIFQCSEIWTWLEILGEGKANGHV